MSALQIAAVIQARYASSRLPAKVLLDIGGKAMLSWVVERARQANTITEVIVATTNTAADDPVAALCQQQGYACVRGSELDVLDRYHQVILAHQPDVIVRITADCPLIDPGLIDETVFAYFGQYLPEQRDPGAFGLPAPWDFAANRLPPPFTRSYPIGLDVEVCSAAALERAWREAHQPHQREHVMPFLYDQAQISDSRQLAAQGWQLPPRPHSFEQSPPGEFRVLLLQHTPDYGALRWTVDTPQDLDLVRLLAARLSTKEHFTWLDVLEIVQNEPELAQINAGIYHKSMLDLDDRQLPKPA